MTGEQRFFSSYTDIKDYLNNQAPEELYFDSNATEVEDDDTSVFAKILSYDANKQKYLVRYDNLAGALYDPIGLSKFKAGKEATFKEVSKDVFDLYFMYLKTKNSNHLTRAQRGVLNG